MQPLRVPIIILTLFICFSVNAQNPIPVNNAAKNPVQCPIVTIDSFNTVVPREKIFTQTDRPSYSNTDTIWLKAYILDAALNYTKQSGLLYTELINDTGKVVMRQSMTIKLGLSVGQMILDDKTVPEGSYTLRAYTNWMQNQGMASFFTKKLYISAVSPNTWLVNETHRVEQKGGVDNVHVAMQLGKPNGDKVRLQYLQLKVTNGEKVLQRDNVKTDIEGKLDLNLNLPAGKTSDLRFVMETGKKDSTHRMIVPITIDRPQNIDLQFMPEGGQLVWGLPSHIGFKAIGENGKGIAVAGDIVDSKGNIAASFKSAGLGMGNFIFMPQPGENYAARITEPAGNNTVFPIGPVAAKGLVMHVANPADKDSLLVSIRVTDDIAKGDPGYTLIGISGGKVCYAANLSVDDGIMNGIISKNRFRDGITRFVVFNKNCQPVVERSVFIDHHQNLRIAISPDKNTYQPKDSVALHINVTNSENQPVEGSFSMAVTDNGMVTTDDNAPDIRIGMLLTGDLKGDIEEPGYYFNPKNSDRYEALDNLLLTQGWVGYNWKDVFDPSYKPAFKAERDLEVTGHISRTGGKSVGGLQVILLSPKKPILMLDTLSDAAGHFIFRNLPQLDTANFILQVKDIKGRMFEANVNVDEFKPANTFGLDNPPMQPWYVNADNTMLNNIKTSIAYNKLQESIKYPFGTHVLKEVKIKSTKSIKGSHNLNGPGQSDQVLDEEDMKKAGKQTLLDVLRAKIKGFNIGFLYDKQLLVVIDGINADFYPDWKYLKRDDWFNQFGAEDIKGIEVLYDDKYNGKYVEQYNPEIMASAVRSQWPAYLEITTWSGNGLFEKRKRGVYIYRPQPVIWPREFYHAKYLPKGNPLADLRPTVLWEPNIITDANGNATVWFYAKGKPANYTGIINGSDLSGSIGSATFTLKIK